MLDFADLEDFCPDWKERQVWACGPSGMLDAATEHWKEAGLEDQLHLERFSLEVGGEAEGGTITFQTSGKTAEADGATTILEAGESVGVGMPYGCRMGICHTCTLTLVSGTVRDLRSGDEFGQPNEPVQTCVTAAVGDCVLDI
jgi:ferredoxin